MYDRVTVAVSGRKDKFPGYKDNVFLDLAKRSAFYKAKLIMQAVMGMNVAQQDVKASAPVATKSKSVAATILVDDSMASSSLNRGSEMAKRLKDVASEEGVAMSRRTYGVDVCEKPLGRILARCKNVWQNHFRQSEKISSAAVMAELNKFATRFEDARLLIIMTSGVGSDLDLSHDVYERAKELGVELLAVCLDSTGKKSAILKRRGLQIHFSETPNYSDEVIIALLRRGFTG